MGIGRAVEKPAESLFVLFVLCADLNNTLWSAILACGSCQFV